MFIDSKEVAFLVVKEFEVSSLSPCSSLVEEEDLVVTLVAMATILETLEEGLGRVLEVGLVVSQLEMRRRRGIDP